MMDEFALNTVVINDKSCQKVYVNMVLMKIIKIHVNVHRNVALREQCSICSKSIAINLSK